MRHLANLQHAGETSSIKIAGAVGTAIAALAMLVVSIVPFAPAADAKPATKAATKVGVLPIVTDKQLGVLRTNADSATRAAWDLYYEANKATCDDPFHDPHFPNKCKGNWVPTPPDAEAVSKYLKELTVELAIVDGVANKTRVNPAAKSHIRFAWGELKQANIKAKKALVTLKALPANANNDISNQALDIATAMVSAEGLAKLVLQNDGSVRRSVKK